MLSIVLMVSGVMTLIFSGFYAYWAGLALLTFVFPIGSLLLFFVSFKAVKRVETFDVQEGWTIDEAAEITNPENPIVAPATLDIKSLDLGMLVIGGPGAGKSMMAMALQEFNYKFRPECGSAYFEGKGDFDIYQTFVKATGHPDFFFSSELEHSDSINVMDAPTETIIDMFSRVFVDSTNGYYEASQKKAIRSTIPLLKLFGTPVILPDLWTVLTNSQAANDLIRKAKAQNLDSDIIAGCEQYFEQEEEERLNNIDGLLNKMHPFVTGMISSRINAYEPTLDIAKAVKDGKRIYFHLPLTDMALAVATMITEIFGVVAKDRQLYQFNDRQAYPLHFDDWGKFFYSNFGPITARCRSARMPISFYFQSRGQTDAVELGNVFTVEITDNIGAIWALRINGWETAKWLAEQFGTYESAAVSFRGEDTEDQMVSVTEKPRVRADALRDLNAGEAYGMIFATKEGGKMTNKRYKLRFPMPNNNEIAPTYWPEIEQGTHNDEAEGLHLWRDYKNAEATAERKKEAVAEVLDSDYEEDEELDDEELFL